MITTETLLPGEDKRRLIQNVNPPSTKIEMRPGLDGVVKECLKEVHRIFYTIPNDCTCRDTTDYPWESHHLAKQVANNVNAMLGENIATYHPGLKNLINAYMFLSFGDDENGATRRLDMRVDSTPWMVISWFIREKGERVPSDVPLEVRIIYRWKDDAETAA